MDNSAIIKRAVQDTLAKLNEPVSPDTLIVHTVASIRDIDMSVNLLGRRLHDWYAEYGPEVSLAITDPADFARTILKKDKEQLLKEINAPHDSGGKMDKKDLQMVLRLAEHIIALATHKDELVAYIERIMRNHMPNLLDLTTPLVGGKLLHATGSLDRLAKLPGSTIQLLGAEDALFRHLKSNTPPPKHGLIIEHPLVNRLPANKKGKMARQLGCKIALAARADKFGTTTTLGKELLKQLEAMER